MEISISNIYIKISILLVVLIGTVEPFISKYLMKNFTIIMMIISLLMLVLANSCKVCVNKLNKKYFLLCLCMFLPSLFNNAAIQDHVFILFINYAFVIAFSLLLATIRLDEIVIEYFFSLYILFAIATSIVTWLSVFKPDVYISKFITLLPIDNQTEVLNNFVRYNNRAGLTTHYSNNAFYILVGIIGCIYLYMKKNRKLTLISLFFLSATMMVVGKRGHFLFLIIALILTYLIYYKFGRRSFIRFFCFIFFFIGGILLLMKIVPESSYTIERLIFSGDDVSNGRFIMIDELLRYWKNNGYSALGWGQYASLTGYSHPGVHNDFLQLFCEVGILGLVSVVGSNIYILIDVIKYTKFYSPQPIHFVCITYNIFFILYSLTGLPHFDNKVYWVYFIINAFFYNKTTHSGQRIIPLRQIN